ncbi:MAG: carbon storage regulator [Pirellulales bacterium]|jgi:carbon storage regulator
MLVLKRRVGENVIIDGRIVVKLLSVSGRTARIGFQAEDDVNILREEIAERVLASTGEYELESVTG